MGKIEYTNEQKDVIFTRDKNLLVSAAAGSGKTAVLSQRIISLISDADRNIDIDRLLIVTFTKAAAAEMRERISNELSKALNNINDENLTDEEKHSKQNNLIRQQSLIANAQITTIDSFCLFVIKNSFSDIDLEPGFRIMDEGEKKLLLQDTLSELLEEHFAQMTPDFRMFIDSYAAKTNESDIEGMIIRTFDFVMSDPFPKKWLENVALKLDVTTMEEMLSNEWWTMFDDVRESMIDEALSWAKKGLDKAINDECFKGYVNTLRDYADNLENIKNEKAYDRRYRILKEADISKLGRPLKGADPTVKEYIVKCRDNAKSIWDELKKAYYCFSEADVLKDQPVIARNTKTLIALVSELIDRFADAKKEKNILDFSDMEHLALSILTKEDENGNIVPSDTALEYRDYFDAVMVDEYQDSNYVQEYILRSITKADNYFMVGDVKQSIYKFRQARPEIFQNKYEAFTEDGINKKIDLNKNFRSRRQVIDFANLIFEGIMKKSTAGMEYDDNASLKYGATYYDEAGSVNYKDYEAELVIVDNISDDDKNELGFGKHKHTAEALIIAERIKKMIAEGYKVYDKDNACLRPASYKDFVVLLRSTSNLDIVYKEVLEKHGIPVFANTKSGYFDTVEVKGILNFLKVIDNPTQDIPMYGVLNSYIGGFTKKELAFIKSRVKNKSLYDSIKELGQEESELKDKIHRFLGLIDEYRNKTIYVGVRNLIEDILQTTGYLDYMTAFKGGNVRRANILMLLERASDFENTSYHGLFRFVRYIEQLRMHDVDYGEAGTIDENEDVVRIMTIHKSKGLEFPVCFVAGMGKEISMKDATGKLLLDAVAGIGLGYINPDKRIAHSSIQKEMMANKIKADSLAEEMRVLYVALTRAREKLIIIGTVKNLAKYEEELVLGEMIRPYSIQKAKTYIDLMMLPLASTQKVSDYVSYMYLDDIKEMLISDNVENILREKSVESFADLCNKDLLKAIRSKYEYVYPYANLKSLYVKTTVSELKKSSYEEHDGKPMFETDEVKKYVPSFIDENVRKSEGTLRGSAYHRIMELLDYKTILLTLNEKGISNKDEAGRNVLKDIVAESIKKHLSTGKYDPKYEGLVDENKCVKFLQSDLAMRMMKADLAGKLYREKAFFKGIKANEINENFPDSEYILVQGVIDVYFEEDGKLIVADYKTDRVQDIHELQDRYKTQLDIYAGALTDITGKEVSEKIIYSFAFGSELLL